MKAKIMKISGYALGVLGGVGLLASQAGATTLLTTTDTQAMVTGQVTALSTSGGAILAAVVVVFAALILFRFGVKWAKKSVK